MLLPTKQAQLNMLTLDYHDLLQIMINDNVYLLGTR